MRRKQLKQRPQQLRQARKNIWPRSRSTCPTATRTSCVVSSDILGLRCAAKTHRLVACSSKDELDRVRESWCKKKLQLAEDGRRARCNDQERMRNNAGRPAEKPGRVLLSARTDERQDQRLDLNISRSFRARPNRKHELKAPPADQQPAGGARLGISGLAYGALAYFGSARTLNLAPAN